MTLERYATLDQLLLPFGAQLQSVDGDRIVYRVNGSAEQLRAQLSLAKLQEVPAGEVQAQQVPILAISFLAWSMEPDTSMRQNITAWLDG